VVSQETSFGSAVEACGNRVVAEAEAFASGEYMLALEKGSTSDCSGAAGSNRQAFALHRSGPKFLDYANLRVNLNLFRKELLRTERRSIGRLDSRFKGYDSNLATDSSDYDASEAAIRPPYTSTFNNYVRTELGYKTDLEYYILGGGIGPWNWGTNNNYVDTSTALRNALAKNPYLKVFVAMGYYDMATPYYAVEYTLGHISIDPSLLKNFSTSYYEAGHMMYIDEKSLTKLHSDVTKFMDDSMRANLHRYTDKNMTTESPATQRDFVELQTDVSHSPLWNRDLAPTTIKESAPGPPGTSPRCGSA
jgi:carboxypeptidase C (cathepsin A)